MFVLLTAEDVGVQGDAVKRGVILSTLFNVGWSRCVRIIKEQIDSILGWWWESLSYNTFPSDCAERRSAI